jgi:hypothetical protein
MPFFSLTDIKIKDPTNTATQGSLLPSQYQSNVLRYPIDIGSLDKGHYMVIHINQQVKSRFKRPVAGEGDIPTILQNQQNFGTKSAISQTVSGLSEIATDIGNTGVGGVLERGSQKAIDIVKKGVNKTENTIDNSALEEITGVGTSVVRGASKTAKEVFNLLNSGDGLRTIERTVDSIALYMPDTINFTNNQQYSSMEFGSSPLALLAAATAGYSQIKDSSNRVEDAVKNLTPFILNSFLRKQFGNQGAGIYAAGTGTVINPQLEMIYTSPSFREFRFDFMLYPRSSKEAIEVQKILNRLRFHQAPEIFKEGAGALGGFFLVPPSEFDIKFYYNGRINPNIPPISTCVLTSIDTDYAPNGWSAYEVPSDSGEPTMGKTGMPVGIRLSLNFQETEIMTKDNFFDEQVLLGRGNYPPGAI